MNTKKLGFAAAIIVASALMSCSLFPSADECVKRDKGVVFNVVPDPNYVFSSYRLVMSADGSSILAQCYWGTCLWNTTDGTVRTMGTEIGIDDWSSNGTWFAGSNYDGCLGIVDANNPENQRFYGGHTVTGSTGNWTGVISVAFSPDSSLVASGGKDSTVRIRKAADGQLVGTLSQVPNPSAIAFNAGGTQLVAAGADGITIWDVASRKLVAQSTTRTVDEMSLGRDGRIVIGGKGFVDVVKAGATGTEATRAVEPGGVDFSPDGKLIAYSDPAARTVVLWDPASGETRTLTGHETAPGAVKFSPDGRTLYSIGKKDPVIAWDVASGHLKQRFAMPKK